MIEIIRRRRIRYRSQPTRSLGWTGGQSRHCGLDSFVVSRKLIVRSDGELGAPTHFSCDRTRITPPDSPCSTPRNICRGLDRDDCRLDALHVLWILVTLWRRGLCDDLSKCVEEPANVVTNLEVGRNRQENARKCCLLRVCNQLDATKSCSSNAAFPMWNGTIEILGHCKLGFDRSGYNRLGFLLTPLQS